jgi:hypothetical protein
VEGLEEGGRSPEEGGQSPACRPPSCPSPLSSRPLQPRPELKPVWLPSLPQSLSLSAAGSRGSGHASGGGDDLRLRIAEAPNSSDPR